MKRFYIPKLFLFSFIIALLAGCSTMEQQSTSPEEALRTRVDSLMEAKVTERWDVVYTHFNKAYRDTLDRQSFAISPKNMKFKSYSIQNIEIEPSGEKAKVELKVSVSMLGYDLKDSKKIHYWVLEDGEWCQFVEIKHPFQKRMKR